MAEITLRKYHGLGNDYLIYDPNRNACELQERQVEALCRRNLGVGADGILYGPFFDGDKMRVRIFNPDGSEAEKSGNGIRIFSKYLKDMGYVTEESYVLHTKAGETRVTFLNGQGDLMRVDMGYPEFVAKEIPVVGFEGEIVNEAIFFGDNFYNATCVSLGNPNCVLMLEEVSQKKAMQLGPYVENSRYFLLNKPGKYTDEEFAQVRLHTQYGYELLKPLPLDAHIKLAALSHHERCDGTGYPNGLTTNDIDPYARVVAIADVYDAMTTARSYRAPLCAFQVIANFERDGLQKYDTKCVLAFLNRIAGTYQNHRILLSDGRSANIVMLNDKQLSRPIVQLDDGSCIDLSTAGDLHIQAVL